MAGSAWSDICRCCPRQPRRRCNGQLGSKREPCCADGLATNADRKSRGCRESSDRLVGCGSHQTVGSDGAKAGRADSFATQDDKHRQREYYGVAGEPYTVQDASGELAAIAIGASLWGLYNQTGEFGASITKPGRIGCQYGYVNLAWQPNSPVFHLARATGLRVADWQDVILVNQAGLRFYDETQGQFTANNYNAVKNYVR